MMDGNDPRKTQKEAAMSIQYLPHLDPMVEMNFTLERCFGQSPDIPNSVPALCESLSQKYSIPME